MGVILFFYFELGGEMKIASGNWGSAVRETEDKIAVVKLGKETFGSSYWEFRKMECTRNRDFSP